MSHVTLVKEQHSSTREGVSYGSWPMQHTATHVHTLEYTATHCNTLQCKILHPMGLALPTQCVAVCCSVLQCVAMCCSPSWPRLQNESRLTLASKMQYTAIHCSTLHHTATHYNSHTHTAMRTCFRGVTRMNHLYTCDLTPWYARSDSFICVT